jgi:replicative superfamily II helicase
MNYTGGQQMKPERNSENLLSITRSKAKMIEYNVPEEYQQIKIKTNPAKLFPLTIGLLGDYSHRVYQTETTRDEISELRNALRFSSRFFDAFFQSMLDNDLKDYLVLLGSAAYYLCDLPGHSTVLLRKSKGEYLDLDAGGLERLLFWLLSSDTVIEQGGKWEYFVQEISKSFYSFVSNGTGEDKIVDILKGFKNVIYENASPRSLLFADIIAAVIKRKIENSCWKALPYYSGLTMSDWASTIKKSGFIKELWPAQHLIGERDVLKGKSAVIQMPTSAGKTKTCEIIIRSAFLSERTSLAVIIAPFRALCHEIYNDLTSAFSNEGPQVIEINDVLQLDIRLEQVSDKKQILIVTPEKLFYVLNHNKEIALLSNLFIFDEGHQFDNGSRGITYELLLTTLLLIIPREAQKILISAVIKNADQISDWLNGEINVVSGNNLIPTYKTVGFVSWIYERGQIHYVKDENKSEDDFFVPRVIEQIHLQKLGRERSVRYFPEKSDAQSIALFLGLKLISNGSVAIFCGIKDSVSKILRKLIDINKRSYLLDTKNLIPNVDEVQLLGRLYAMNLGNECPASQGAYLGVFSHHNSIPQGIRIAVEYAMHENMVNFVVCTSTLAQGVNLPIRYLIIPSYYQAGEYIKTRDFHNLIGRAGRAGMHTEGSIIFADPKIYDGRNVYNEQKYWRKAQDLLEPEKNEPCTSELSIIFEPLKDKYKKDETPLDLLEFVNSYFESTDIVRSLIDNILLEKNQNGNFDKKDLEHQFSIRINLISAIENFMLSNWDELESLKGSNQYSDIVFKTLGYSLADDEMRSQLSGLFNTIEHYIRKNITDPEKRKIYGKTLYGIKDALFLEEWFNNNIQNLRESNTEESLLDLIWTVLRDTFINKADLKITNIDNLKSIIMAWISGVSYRELVDIFSENNIKIKRTKQTRRIDIDKVVDICENIFSFNGCLALNAIYEFAAQDEDANRGAMILLQKFQKRLKYGLPDEASIILYEICFCDRIIAQDMVNLLKISGDDKLQILFTIKSNRDLAMTAISKYPAYYQMKMNRLVN